MQKQVEKPLPVRFFGGKKGWTVPGSPIFGVRRGKAKASDTDEEEGKEGDDR